MLELWSRRAYQLCPEEEDEEEETRESGEGSSSGTTGVGVGVGVGVGGAAGVGAGSDSGSSEEGGSPAPAPPAAPAPAPGLWAPPLRASSPPGRCLYARHVLIFILSLPILYIAAGSAPQTFYRFVVIWSPERCRIYA